MKKNNRLDCNRKSKDDSKAINLFYEANSILFTLLNNN